MRVADRIAQLCKESNEHTFLFVGGGNMYLADALGKAGINYVCMHHEQALSIAAEAYAKYTGKPSVCIVTTGPGGINALNGVAGAWLDSTPLIVISGQVRKPMMAPKGLRQLGDQELPIVDIVKPITKYANVVMSSEHVDDMWLEAYKLATHGKPGPVWLDIPLDVQSAEYLPSPTKRVYSNLGYSTIESDVASILRHYDKPIILAGNGIRKSGGLGEFRKLIENFNIPVALDVNAMDLLPTQHPLNMGAFGMLGHQVTNDIIQEADLILILGCRMSIRQTGYGGNLGEKAIKIMVDVDRGELDKYTFKPTLKLEADVHQFLVNLNWSLWKQGASKFNMWVKDYKLTIDRSQLIDYILQISERVKDRENVIVSANGTIPTYLNRFWCFYEGDRYIVSSGLGTMGFGLPAAIGAALASKKRVICFEGDGSLQLNIQELQTLKTLNLPVKLFVINNGGYASLKATQDNYFNGNYVGRGPESRLEFPDLQGIAQAYQIPYEKGFNGWGTLLSGTEGPIIYELEVPDEPLSKATYV